MVGRIVRTADFERVLSAPAHARSPHFAAHHVAMEEGTARGLVAEDGHICLSTAVVPGAVRLVDESPASAQAEDSMPSGGAVAGLSQQAHRGPVPATTDPHCLGMVVPKRHARRAVTRSLIKRQMRAAMAEWAAQLPPGLWVLRLRAGFDRRRFVSASSDLLRRSVHDEIHRLLARAAQAPARGPRPPACP